MTKREKQQEKKGIEGTIESQFTDVEKRTNNLPTKTGEDLPEGSLTQFMLLPIQKNTITRNCDNKLGLMKWFTGPTR